MSIKCEANDHSNDQRSITGHCEEDLVADQSDGTSTTFTLEEELLFAQCLEEKDMTWLILSTQNGSNTMFQNTRGGSTGGGGRGAIAP